MKNLPLELSRSFDEVSKDSSSFNDLNIDDLESKKEVLKNIFEKSEEGFYVRELSGEIIYVNRAFADLHNYEQKELLGRNSREFLTRESSEKYKNQDIRDLEERWHEVEIETKGKEKKKVWNLLTFLRDKKGKKQQVLGITRDVTELDEKKEILNYLLSHDVLNKTQLIEGYFSLLSEYDLPKEVEDLVEKGRRLTQKNLKLLEKIRNLESMDHEDVDNRLDLSEAVRGTIEGYKDAAAKKGIKIVNSVNRGKIKAGPLFTEVISNIIDNSIKHSRCERIVIDSHEKGEEVVLTIEDDGNGIPDREKEKVLHRGLKRGNNAGSGLGMYLVQEIVRKYDGEIEVKDSEHGGARFDVYLKRWINKI